MSRYRGPRVKIVKRLGTLPGLTRKSPKKRPNRSRLSQYGIRLCEKQKLRYHYGLSEHQLLRYVKKAKQASGSTSRALMKSLELRLDNIVFRLGFATTIPESRQLINHGHFLVNNKSVDIPSFQCTPGDSITIEDKDQINVWRERINNSSNLSVPTFLELDKEKLIGSVKSIVGRNEVGLNVNELLIVEYYSRK